MRRCLPVILIAGLLALLSACKCKEQAAAPAVSPDHLPALNKPNDAQGKPINFLHKTFTVKKSAQFSIEVPPHSVIPRIHGTFEAFVPRAGDDNLSDDSTDVTFLLMNSEQFVDYVRNPAGSTSLYTVEATHNHEVGFVLPPTNDSPAKYYVVFINAPGGAPVKSVTADFGLFFGYQ
jgi:hypothetical protein